MPGKSRMGSETKPGETTSGDEALLPAATPMISYAQNFEDVMLRRALSDIQRGFYIDLGAFHPEVDNVTRWFYGQGWTGVNVEPNPAFFRLLQEQRPHDVNLPLAVADAPGTVRLHLLDGLSTIVDEVDQRHRGEGQDESAVAEVEAVTLDQIFSQWADGRTVDFLKVDVEGAEAAVLNACAFRDCRPRILLVEATEPNSTRPAEDAWEPQLLSRGYIFAYFDGLNRFYVREEDAWRAQRLRVPPNVFDRFLLPLADARVDLAGARRGTDPGMPIGGVAGLLAQRDDLAAQLDSFKARTAETAAAELEASRHHAEQTARQEGRIEQLGAELEACRRRAEQAEAQGAHKDARIGQLDARIAQLEAVLAAANEERDRRTLELAQLNLKVRSAARERDEWSRERDELALQLEQAHATVSAIHASRSWRITAPLRRLKGGS
jgi:FkbM family methyltransferase